MGEMAELLLGWELQFAGGVGLAGVRLGIGWAARSRGLRLVRDGARPVSRCLRVVRTAASVVSRCLRDRVGAVSAPDICGREGMTAADEPPGSWQQGGRAEVANCYHEWYH